MSNTLKTTLLLGLLTGIILWFGEFLGGSQGLMVAFVFAAEMAYQASQHSLHVHGGYGFTEEYDIQLYYRRAKAWAVAFADPRHELAGEEPREWPVGQDRAGRTERAHRVVGGRKGGVSPRDQFAVP